MGFVKLDSGLLTSTLWAHREQREVFVTALLMAEPFELKEPAAQLHVDSLEETGFMVPPGWYGFVAAAGPGILRTAIVKPGPGMEALRALGQPETESRSKDHEGRRLVRIDGGYIVLNYIKYRDRDYTAATRSQRYRDRRKTGADTVTASRRDGVTTRRNVTQAEAEAEAEADKKEAAAGAPPPAAASLVPALPVSKGTWMPPADSVRLWQERWPGLDVLAELGRIAGFLATHPRVRYSEERLVRWIEDWLAKEAKPTRRRGKPGVSPPPGAGNPGPPPVPPRPCRPQWAPTWAQHEAMLRESGQALRMEPEDLEAWVREVKAEWDEVHEEAMC